MHDDHDPVDRELRVLFYRIAYDAGGAPLGNSRQALEPWRRFRTWTTTS